MEKGDEETIHKKKQTKKQKRSYGREFRWKDVEMYKWSGRGRETVADGKGIKVGRPKDGTTRH